MKRANNHAIQTTALTKKFGDFTAVNDVSFTVKRGEIFGFLGPNGAGKTTTMRMLMGLLPPSSGSVTVLGYSLFQYISTNNELNKLVDEGRYKGYLELKIRPELDGAGIGFRLMF